MERTVIDTIRTLRKERGLTQEELSKKLFCKRQKIADWERYKTFPSADDIIALSKIFGVTTDYLLGQSIAKTKDITLQAVCDYTKLSEEAVRKLTSCGEEHSDSPNFRAILNSFISSKAFTDIVRGVGQYIVQKEKLEKAQKCSDFSDEVQALEKEVDFSLFCIQERISDFAKNIKID